MSLKQATATSLKWNTIDRLGTQAVFAAVGIVLARELSREDFGMVSALMIFQGFAMVMADGGFGAALLQLKDPGERDYSTVLWFNAAMSLALYALLWLLAPWLAGFFQGDLRLVPLSKVLFLSMVANALGVVQTNRLMKRMNIRPLAICNLSALLAGGAVGVWLASTGAGAWALVWQTLVQAGLRTALLWVAGKWLPLPCFSLESLRRVMPVGMGVLGSQLLNTFFLQLYNFVVGHWYSLTRLGVFNQADKWSKMGTVSIMQTLTSTFVPLLSGVQDDPERFARYMRREERFAAFVSLPVLGGMACVAAPLFHFLLGSKWDDAIPLFQLLCLRGVPMVMTSVLANQLLALGYARTMVVTETVKDVALLLGVVATIWFGTLEALVWGMTAASTATWLTVLWIFSRRSGHGWAGHLRAMAPFLLPAALACAAAWGAQQLLGAAPAGWKLLAGAAAGAATYVAALKATRVPELGETWRYLRGKADF